MGNEITLTDILKTEFSWTGTLQNSIKIGDLDYELYHIQEVTYEERAPRREVVENILGALRLKGINFIYLIIGNRESINFYVGVSNSRRTKKTVLDIDDVSELILEANIKGNIRGAKIEKLDRLKKREIRQKLARYAYIAEINGIPDIHEEGEEFQGFDRLVDIMSGDDFAMMILAEELSYKELLRIEKDLYNIYDKIAPHAKTTIQKTVTNTQSEVETKAKNDTKSDSHVVTTSESDTTTTTNSETVSTNKQRTIDSSTTESGGESKTKSDTTTSTTSASRSDTKSSSSTDTVSYTNSKSENETKTTTIEFATKESEEWLKYIDEILLKRVNYAKGKGGFKCGIYLFGDTRGKVVKLANSFISIFSGVKENKLPLRYTFVKNEIQKQSILNFTLPHYDSVLNENQKYKMILYSQFYGNEWLSAKELSLIASFPKKEVSGLRVKEEVLFGLNVPSTDGIEIGELLKYGNKTGTKVYLPKEDLNKHIFVTGVTGSGKTTTCQKILLESDLPFLVIEPAKTEYRVLMNLDDVLIFTFGDESVAPFRLNPFEFFENELITARVDMIKAAIESSFDMEAAIPQIIESAIYRAYEKKGWDIGLNVNLFYENPFDRDVDAFPTLEDVIDEVENVVSEQNFDERLHRDYIASIRARLQSFLVGNKRFMLNTKRSFDFKKLLEKRVVIELEHIKNPDEKSFIMGLILINLNEALKEIYYEKKKEGVRFGHITLIEEAHRLLSRYEVGDSLNKKRGVEAFSDMLAEVRKYGESLIIADQIPNKLTADVLKNTNTKIVHRLFARDDKEAIGNTMALEEEQKEFLSKLDTGKAVMFNQKFFNPVHIQVLRATDTTSLQEVSEEAIARRWEEFFEEEYGYENGRLFLSLEKLFGVLLESIEKRGSNERQILKKIKELLERVDLEDATEFINRSIYDGKKDVREIFNLILNDEMRGLNLKKLRRE